MRYGCITLYGAHNLIKYCLKAHRGSGKVIMRQEVSDTMSEKFIKSK